MAADSSLRRVLKRLLAPFVRSGLYKYFQAAAMAWDIRRGSFTEPELALLSSGVHPGETVLDIGANYGLYSYHLSRAVGASGQVYAFEPVPFTCAALRLIRRVLRLKNVEVIEKGCSDKTGPVTFQVPLQPSGAISAGQSYIGARNDDHVGKEQQVRWSKTTQVSCEVVALDEFFPSPPNVSLIKCDIEGAELFAFRGAARIIDQNQPTILCEINPWFLDGFGIRLEELTGFFLDRGYRMYHFNDAKQCLNRLTAKDDIPEDNYLFIHPSKQDRFRRFLNGSDLLRK